MEFRVRVYGRESHFQDQVKFKHLGKFMGSLQNRVHQASLRALSDVAGFCMLKTALYRGCLETSPCGYLKRPCSQKLLPLSLPRVLSKHDSK